MNRKQQDRKIKKLTSVIILRGRKNLGTDGIIVIYRVGTE